MKCRRFLSFALVVLFAFFFGSFITTQNSFAVDDLSITLTSSNYSDFSNSPLFSSCNDSSCLSNYHYLSISGSGSSFNQYANWTIRGLRGVNDVRVYVNSSVLIDGSSSLSFGSLFLSGDVSYTFTLSDSLPCSCPSCPELPSGNIDISSNGTYDVTNYAQATVNVPAEVIQGDYHNDLVNIQKSIIICGAILLVLYFFYCIYRLIIKNSGVH